MIFPETTEENAMNLFRINVYNGSFDYVDPSNAVVASWAKAKVYFFISLKCRLTWFRRAWEYPGIIFQGISR